MEREIKRRKTRPTVLFREELEESVGLQRHLGPHLLCERPPEARAERHVGEEEGVALLQGGGGGGGLAPEELGQALLDLLIF